MIIQLSLTQRIVRIFVNDLRFERISQESRRWVFTCNACRKEANIWDLGGVRYKTSGSGRTGAKCPHCRTFAMQEIVKKYG